MYPYYTPLKPAEARKIVGNKTLEAVGRLNCDLTNRVFPDNDKRLEWSTEPIACLVEGQEARIVAYYYTTPSDQKIVDESGGDWGSVNFVVRHYEIID